MLWLVLLPFTIPCKVIKWIFILWLNYVCAVLLLIAAVVVYVPKFGDTLAHICLIPVKIASILDSPLFKLAIEALKVRIQIPSSSSAKEN